MSKQHFIEFAKQIRALRQAAVAASARGDSNVAIQTNQQAAACEALVITVAGQFNPRFDANRFLEACHQ